jgi:hypothetical protein
MTAMTAVTHFLGKKHHHNPPLCVCYKNVIAVTAANIKHLHVIGHVIARS